MREVPARDGQQFRRLVAQHLLQGAVRLDDFSLQILDGNPRARALEQCAETRFAALAHQLRLALLLLFRHLAQPPLHRRGGFSKQLLNLQNLSRRS